MFMHAFANFAFVHVQDQSTHFKPLCCLIWRSQSKIASFLKTTFKFLYDILSCFFQATEVTKKSSAASGTEIFFEDFQCNS